MTDPLIGSFDVGLDLVLDGIERLTELFPERDSRPEHRGSSQPANQRPAQSLATEKPAQPPPAKRRR